MSNPFQIPGLSSAEVLRSRLQSGSNQLTFHKDSRLWDAVKSLAREPMIILLLIASSIYFVTGDTGDGIFLASAIVLVSAISLYQDARSRNALGKLNEFSQPACTVIRNGIETEIKIAELVVGDSLIVEEGNSVSADGRIVHSNDFSVNESVLTGESVPVYKDASSENHFIYRGTTVAGGLAIATVTAIGNETKLGKIGKSLENIKPEKTPLELQINQFVKIMVITGAIVFVIVWIIHFIRSRGMLDSLLKSLTLAMSILPEEIPVAFTSFMALGAWRLMKTGIIVKQMKTVETLGSATVICTDKTGTLTENKMSLVRLYLPESGLLLHPAENLSDEGRKILRTAMFASEPIPFDPMERSLHDAYEHSVPSDERPAFHMVHEYPLGGKPPMMTHVFEDGNGRRIIAAKGAPEALIDVCGLTTTEKVKLNQAIETMTAVGYRVLGVAGAKFEGAGFPARQQDFPFHFEGIVAFYDPPKKNIESVLNSFYQAGIAVKIITGDNAETTGSVARQIGLRGYEKNITGAQLMQMNDMELEKTVEETALFTRMFPEAKLRIINALKKDQEIVAMIGDGVNDGPALKSAHIGIAMGKKGTEIAKQAASLILLEDDLSKLTDAVAIGRKIYSNLKKAIRYIISIHIPIILTVFIPLALGWIYPNIFTPVHILFLELIMGPTCSIIYENEPMEKNSMLQKPRPLTSTFFNRKELTTSILQGLLITAGTLGIYQYAVTRGFNEKQTRAMVFTAIITANIFLTLVNRSFFYSVFTTLKYKNNLVPLVILVTLLITGMLIYIRPLSRFFLFESLQWTQLLPAMATGFVSVIWYEVIKWRKRKTQTTGVD